jgi:hypothetical protein
MRFLLAGLVSLLVIGMAAADPLVVTTGKVRLAEATIDACIANCASQSDSCKRVCPTTLSAPCISSCDSQAQTCRLACRSK